MTRGLFITFEGGDGAGKTTQASHVESLLVDHGEQVLRTREPGGTDIGAEIRAIVLHSKGFLEPRAEALLFAADRAQNIATKVKPALERGEHVVQDRYFDSSVAYQGAGRALDPVYILQLSLWAADDLYPDLTVLLDLDPEIAAERVGNRGAADRMEAERHEFRTRLRDGFLTIAAAQPQRFLVVDASQPESIIRETVATRVLHDLRGRRR